MTILYQIPSLKVLKKIKILTSYFWLKISKKNFQSWLMRATSLSCMDIQLHFLKIFILKTRSLLEHDWQKYFVIILFKDWIWY